MKLLFPLLLAACLAGAQSRPFEGRWDLTITTPESTYPDWIAIKRSDRGLAALIQPRGGGAFTASDVQLKGSHLVITAKAANGSAPAEIWDLTADGDKVSGIVRKGDAESGRVAGTRAPALKHPAPKAWSDPQPLFNGKDLTGWEAITPGKNHWAVKDGELVNAAGGSNLKTVRKFDDFKLHLEFNCPEKGNSGIYLRGRYEVQIEYEPVDANDPLHSIGSIYSFLAPAVNLPRTPGTWESFDIMLVGRWVTVVRNGVKTIDNQEIPGITGGALDSDEGAPGPIYIQGDHTGGLRFRNITISVPK